jgi:TonB family protein
MHGKALILALLIGFQGAQGQAVAEGLPLSFPPYPLEAHKNHEVGTVIVEVSFDAKGDVSDCHVVLSTASSLLDTNTVRFIKRNWHSAAFAETTHILPITYMMSRESASAKKAEMPPPPDPLVAGDTEREMTLRLTFGADGWVDRIGVVKSSGSSVIDRQTEVWIKATWHIEDNAGKVLDVPFDFKPPAKPRKIQGQVGG